ncbi:unnamed protein product, partial [Ostreobium quekettii]
MRRNGGGLRAEALLEKLLQECGDVRSMLAAEQAENKRLKARLTSLADEQHAEDQARVAGRQALAVLRQDIANTQIELERQKARFEEIDLQSRDRRDRIEEMEKENKELRQAKDELAHKLHVQVQKLSDEAYRLKTKSKESIRKAQSEREVRKVQEEEIGKLKLRLSGLEHLEGESHDMRRALESVRRDRARVQDEKWEADEKVEKLSVDLETVQIALQREEHANRGLQTRVEVMERDLKAARAQNNILRSNSAGAEIELQDLRNFEAEAKKLRQNMEDVKSIMSEVDGAARQYIILKQSCDACAESCNAVDGIGEDDLLIRRWRAQ